MDLLQLKVTRIIPETKDANTYVMEPVGHGPVSYDAGQFLTLLIPHHNHEIRRSYSLASAPGVDDSLLVTIKKVENGKYRGVCWRPSARAMCSPALRLPDVSYYR